MLTGLEIEYYVVDIFVELVPVAGRLDVDGSHPPALRSQVGDEMTSDESSGARDDNEISSHDRSLEW
jgi:hypothetical protein